MRHHNRKVSAAYSSTFGHICAHSPASTQRTRLAHTACSACQRAFVLTAAFYLRAPLAAACGSSVSVTVHPCTHERRATQRWSSSPAHRMDWLTSSKADAFIRLRLAPSRRCRQNNSLRLQQRQEMHSSMHCRIAAKSTGMRARISGTRSEMKFTKDGVEQPAEAAQRRWLVQ